MNKIIFATLVFIVIFVQSAAITYSCNKYYGIYEQGR
jgi:hypothetical protein